MDIVLYREKEQVISIMRWPGVNLSIEYYLIYVYIQNALHSSNIGKFSFFVICFVW